MTDPFLDELAGRLGDVDRPVDPVGLMVAAGMTPDAWQADFLRDRPARALLLCCRQAGKSTVTAAAALHEALTNAGSTTLLISASQRQSAELLEKVRRLAEAQNPAPGMDQLSVLSLRLGNGSRVISLPGRSDVIRGYSADLLVIDEAAWVPDNLYQATRPMLAITGGRLVALSTPYGRRGWFHSAWQSPEDWRRVKIAAEGVSRITPEFLAEERRNLPANAFASEYLCEFVDEVQGALWTRELLDRTRVAEHRPAFWNRVVVGLDPAEGKASGAEQGLAVVAQSAEDQQLYVLESGGLRVTPWAFLNHAVNVALRYLPARVTLVIEKNHGGEWLVQLLEQLYRERGDRVAYRVVSASRAKRTRAEPVAGLYERGRVHHVGSHPELEVQMTSFTGGPGEQSPDRLDALVWACWPFVSQALDVSSVPSGTGAAVPYTYRQVPGGAVGRSMFQPDPSWPLSGSLFEDPSIRQEEWIVSPSRATGPW